MPQIDFRIMALAVALENIAIADAARAVVPAHEPSMIAEMMVNYLSFEMTSMDVVRYALTFAGMTFCVGCYVGWTLRGWTGNIKAKTKNKKIQSQTCFTQVRGGAAPRFQPFTFEQGAFDD